MQWIRRSFFTKGVALMAVPLSPWSFLKGCGGGEDGTGSLMVSLQGNAQETAIVSYIDTNCPSLGGRTVVGATFELCPEATAVEPVTDCEGYGIGFPEINGCTDVLLGPAAIGENLQILNDCRGIMSGRLEDETGLCLLTASGEACECQVDEAALPGAHNSDFALRMSEGIAALRAVSESAKSKVFAGIENPDEAEFEELDPGDGSSAYRFTCDLF